jgi:crotonyl-CoA reductase
MDEICQAVVDGDYAAAASMPVPTSYRAVTVHADDAEMFESIRLRDRDPRTDPHLYLPAPLRQV